jgi:hypothetical protein
MKENIRQTLRLTITNAFKSGQDRKFTIQTQSILQQCPSLFSTILPLSEFASLTLADLNDDDKEEDVAEVLSDDTHRDVTVIGCIQASYCREHSLPTRYSTASVDFRVALSKAHQMSGPIDFRGTFQWCKKLAFTDIANRRVVIRMGQFLNIGQHVNRVNYILVHRWDGKRRVFLHVPETRQELIDPVLDCPVLHIDDAANASLTLIGFSLVSSQPLYLIPIEMDDQPGQLKLGGTNSTRLLWSQQTLTWL